MALPRTMTMLNIKRNAEKESSEADVLNELRNSAAGTTSKKESPVSAVAEKPGTSAAAPQDGATGTLAGMPPFEPMYQALREEVLDQHPIFKMDAEVESWLKESGDLGKQMVSGKLPKSVVQEIERNSAEAGLRMGLGSGQAARNLTARDLGLKSLEYATAGAQLAQTAAAGVMDYNKAIEGVRASRMDTLGKMMQLNMADWELREKARQFDTEESRLRLASIGQLLDSYHRIGVAYAGTPDASQTSVEVMTDDFTKLMDDMRTKWGI